MQNQMNIQSSYGEDSDAVKFQTRKESYVELNETMGTFKDTETYNNESL